MMYSLYIISNNINDKIYIGVSKNPTRRWYEHRWQAKQDNPKIFIHKAIKKYGEDNFNFDVVETGLTKQQVEMSEMRYIAIYNSNNKEFGYNICKGGILGNGLSGERNGMYGKKRPDLSARNRLNIGGTTSQKQKEIASLTHKGKPKSEETRRKISESTKGKMVSEATRVKFKFNSLGKYGLGLSKAIKCIESGETFVSARQAGIKMGFGNDSGTNIGAAARGVLKTAYGHTFEYIDKEKLTA